ncbi:unnamed protein product, partial [Lepeophtheirus salmonis]
SVGIDHEGFCHYSPSPDWNIDFLVNQAILHIWLEMKETRSGLLEYYQNYGINASYFDFAPSTMEYIRVTEEGYKITGIEANGAPYNGSITWRKEAKRPMNISRFVLEFDSEVYKDHCSRNVIRFNGYLKGSGTPLFYTIRSFTMEGCILRIN